MDKSTDILRADTLRVWQPRASRSLSGEDARQIIENATGFFLTLIAWDVSERTSRTEDSSNTPLDNPISKAIASTNPMPTAKGGRNVG